MVSDPFAFLEPLVELENKIGELERLGHSTGLDMSNELRSLHQKFEDETRRTFAALDPWQRVQLARHPQRPQASDYFDHCFGDVVPLAGDRLYGDDGAVLVGLGRIDDLRCVVIGQQKGKDVHERARCNFGMPHPEGYRKALRAMRLAEKFALPVVTLINTPGAYPGIQAEERGQSLAIAENLREMFRIRVPIVSVVIGEGGSGGALGIGVGDRLLMLENSYYSVISPEGCAAILYKDGTRAKDAAASLKITASALKELGVIDEIVPEPAGGAHRQPLLAVEAVKQCIAKHLRALRALDQAALLDGRYAKFRAMGVCHG